MSAITKLLVILSGLVGIVLAFLLALAAMIFSGDNAVYDTMLLLLGIIEMIGAALSIVFGYRLNEENSQMVGVICFLLAVLFLFWGITFIATATALPIVLYVAAGFFCFFGKEEKTE